MVHNIRKLCLMSVLFLFFAVTTGCNESGLTGADSSPEIISTTPADNADSVSVYTSISVTFSEVMDSSSIHGGSFIVKIDSLNISGTFSYSDLTAVFIPSNPMEYGSTYSIMVTPEAKSLSGVSLADNHEWSFSTVDGENTDIPRVLSTNPAQNAEGVFVNSAIMVSFNKPMNSNSLNTSTFTVFQGSTPISGLVTSANSTATFSPFSVLSSGSTYHAVISSDVQDTDGNKLENNFEWSFSTLDEADNTPPQIQSVSPSDTERSVPVDKIISAYFSETLDNASVNSSTFLVKQNGNSVSGSIGLSGSTISFTPNAALPHEAEVTALITTGVKDEAGNNLPADYEWSFVIMDEPDDISPEVTSTNPTANATHVDVKSLITATFSEPMNESTINSSTIIVTKEGDTVSGSISYSGNKVTFNPNGDLREKKTYQVTITKGVEDLAGNALQSDFVWTFRTEHDDD